MAHVGLFEGTDAGVVVILVANAVKEDERGLMPGLQAGQLVGLGFEGALDVVGREQRERLLVGTRDAAAGRGTFPRREGRPRTPCRS